MLASRLEPPMFDEIFGKIGGRESATARLTSEGG
jgi:hypothetical protein